MILEASYETHMLPPRATGSGISGTSAELPVMLSQASVSVYRYAGVCASAVPDNIEGPGSHVKKRGVFQSGLVK